MSVGKDMEKLEHLCTIGWKVNGAVNVKKGLAVPQTLRYRITI